MRIPFIKAHGARNDFLLTLRDEVRDWDLPVIARAICGRHTGVGADGWILVTAPSAAEPDSAIQLYNSDGSTAEISGNGTRCAAAWLVQRDTAGDKIRIRTGAGLKTLRLLRRNGLQFQFEMNMGQAEVRTLRFELPLAAGTRDVVLVWVGNPQCAVPVTHFDFDWRAMGAEIESHPHFPNRTNVSFWKPVDEHTIETRFYERGAGETMSSGTGSTGAAAAAAARGYVRSPVRVLTPAGPIDIRLENDAYLTGPAEIVAEGVFLYNEE
ncbi:MAG TPA: diaminopimelate epimerase [Bryobacteraceae bacterium]|jgi:diaminopimelate epimerase